MIHRHLNHQQYTPAAIDDIISRGRRPDWQALRKSFLADRSLGDRIKAVCQPRLGDPFAQRYHFWNYYVEHRAT
jgi:hypothetical protein